MSRGGGGIFPWPLAIPFESLVFCICEGGGGFVTRYFRELIVYIHIISAFVDR